MSDVAERAGEAHDGGCQCGAIRYRVSGPIESVAHCHCGMCRRASGALALTWFTVPKDRFTVSKGALARWNSSANAERTFCPSCGAQITFWSTRSPDELDVTLGTLDHPQRHPAHRHVWTDSKVAWLHLDEHLPDYPATTPEGS